MSVHLSHQELVKLRVFVQKLVDGTLSGSITWQPTDKPGGYVHTAAVGSVLLDGPTGARSMAASPLAGLFGASVISIRLLDDDGQIELQYSSTGPSMLSSTHFAIGDHELDSSLKELFAMIDGSVESRLETLDAWIESVSRAT